MLLPARVVVAISGLAAIGCPTVDLGEVPVSPSGCRPDETYYRDIIWPEYVAPPDPTRSCVATSGCHQLENGRSAFRVSVTDPIDHAENYMVLTRFLTCSAPETSAALTKPLSGTDPHGGGDLFDLNSEPANTFLLWFDQ